jgi:hypothetical protein
MHATYRSWHLEKYAMFDLCLLSKMAEVIIKKFEFRTLGTLYVTANNAHIDYHSSIL